MNRRALPVTAMLLVLVACSPTNEAPGNDREAGTEPPAAAAPRMGAAAALAGVEPVAIQPETMGDADLASLGGTRGRCLFRLTRVAYPSVLYDGAEATIKLNGKLVTLPQASAGRYQDGGLQVTLPPLTAAPAPTGLQSALLVMLPAGARQERRYLGYSECANP